MALPVNGCSTHLIPAYYSIYRPRKDERLSWPSRLTYSGWLTHISGHPSAAGRAQDRESSPARDRRSTTVPRHQGRVKCVNDSHELGQEGSDDSGRAAMEESGVSKSGRHGAKRSGSTCLCVCLAWHSINVKKLRFVISLSRTKPR